MINFTWHECRMLDTKFLESHPEYLVMPLDSSDCFRKYFISLRDLAEKNIPLAHSVNTTTSAKACLACSSYDGHNEISKRTCPAAFSVVKNYDTFSIDLEKNTISGSKAWISTLMTGEFGVFKFKGPETAHVYIEFERKDTDQFKEEYKNVCGPGMFQSGTGELYLKDYEIIQGWNTFKINSIVRLSLAKALSLMVPTIIYGGCIRLSKELEMRGEELDLLSARWHNIVDSGISFEITKDINSINSSEVREFYYKSKQLLADLCAYIIQNSLVKFYNPETELGKYFYDSMMYSTHKNSNFFDKG